MDLAPLVKPSLGRDANYMFWIRLVFIVIPITYGIFSQIGFLTPRLNMTRRDAGVTSVFVTSLCLAYDYLIAGYIPLPVPFFFLAATLPFLFAMGTMIAILFGKKLVQDAELRMSFYRAMAVIITELSLTVIYPIYIYGFNSIPSSYQSPYMTLVPLMKVISKNVMSKFVGRMDDLKPEVLIFNVDTFNALYVTLAMQKATTISTSLLIMLIDTAQGCISISDVYNAYMPIKRLMKKLPKDHSLQGKSFIEVAIALDTCMVEAKQASAPVATLYDGQVGQEEVAVFDGQNLQTKSSIAQLDAAPIKSRNKIYIIPTKATKAPSDSSITVAVGRTNSTFTTARSTSQVSAPLSEKDCAAFLLATRRMLFTIEFVILIEYSEVIIPVFYSASCDSGWLKFFDCSLFLDLQVCARQPSIIYPIASFTPRSPALTSSSCAPWSRACSATPASSSSRSQS